MLEEQIAEKERQRQDARSHRRGEGDVQNPMAPLQGRSPAVQPVRQAGHWDWGWLKGFICFMAQHWPRKCGN